MRSVAGILLLATVIAVPWLGGAILITPQWWAAAGVALACGLYVIDLIASSRRPGRIHFAFWAAAVGVPLALLQLLPIEQSMLERLSPVAAKIWNDSHPHLSTDIDDFKLVIPSGGASNPSTLSIAPSRTRDQLAQLLTCLCVFWLTVELFPNVRGRRIFLAVIVANGALLAFVALAQKLGDRNLVFWTPHSNWFGPFRNRNNGAGYVNLCIAAAAAWLWSHLSDAANRSDIHSIRSLATRGAAPAFLAVSAAAILMLAAVAASLSRGALLSVVCGAIVTGVVIALIQRRPRLLALLAACGIIAAGMVAWLGLYRDVETRLQTLTDSTQLTADGRIANWRAGLPAARAFFPCGAGLGAYVYAYPPFQRTASTERFLHPENTMLQTAVEAGLIGMLGLAAAWISGLRTVVGRLRFRAGATSFLGVLGLFLIAAQTAHSFLDYGWYVQANSLLLAGLCGAALGRIDDERSNTFDSPNRATTKFLEHRGPVIRTATVLLLVIGTAWAATRLTRESRIRRAVDAAEAIVDGPDVKTDAIAARLTDLLHATGQCDASGAVSRRIAELYILMYQDRAANELAGDDGAGRRQVWVAASTASLFAAAARLERERDDAGLEALRNHPSVLRYLLPAQRWLGVARCDVPADPIIATYLGELHCLLGSPADGARYFISALEFSPARPQILLRNGLNLLAAGERERGLAALSSCWRLNPAYEPRICELAPLRLTVDELILQVAPDYDAKRRAVERLLPGEQHAEARRLLLERGGLPSAN